MTRFEFVVITMRSIRKQILKYLGLILSHLFAFNCGKSNFPYCQFDISNVAAPAAIVQNKFDEIRQMLYKEAIKPKNSGHRSKFSLEGWTKGSGGLVDVDRMTLGDLYLNAKSVFEYGLGNLLLLQRTQVFHVTQALIAMHCG